MREKRYIVVEGPIGAGKTSLARILADEFRARLVLERVDENPFLKRFYEDPEKNAFPTQLFFLLTRYQQQKELARDDVFNQNIIVDYLFAKDYLFARANLDPDELGLYQQLFSLLDARIRRPDLVVYLEARVEVLLNRIRKRAKDYEQRITPRYVEQIAEVYRDFFFHYDEAPLLVVNCSDIDFVANSAHTVDLIREIREMGQGVQHYIPLGSR